MEKFPKRLSEKELSHLEEIERLADCGPWKALIDLRGAVDTFTPDDGIQFGGEGDYGGFSTPGIGSGGFDGAATVRLLAAMRNALPRMLAEIRAARSSQRSLRKGLRARTGETPAKIGTRKASVVRWADAKNDGLGAAQNN